MGNRLRTVFILLSLLTPFLPFPAILSDVGPKPGMDFKFVQGIEGEQLTITSGTLLECEEADCQDAAPLRELGPQRFTCDATSCSAMAYGFSTYHQLEIQFSDGLTRRSNIFTTAGFNATYVVTIHETDLEVKSQFSLDPLNLIPVSNSPRSYLGIILICGLCLVGLVVIIVVIVLLVRRGKKK